MNVCSSYEVLDSDYWLISVITPNTVCVTPPYDQQGELVSSLPPPTGSADTAAPPWQWKPVHTGRP